MTENISPKYTLEVSNFNIINADTIIEEINNETNYTMLKKYHEILKNNLQLHNYENFNIILETLGTRLKVLESNEFIFEEDNPLNDLLGVEVTLEEVYPLIRNYIYNKALDQHEQNKIFAYLGNIITILETGFTLETIEDELLRTCINYIENKEKNNYETAILAKYNKYLEKNNSSSMGMNQDSKKKTYGVPGNPAPLLLTDNGVSLTIIIITITVIIGSFAAALLLVN